MLRLPAPLRPYALGALAAILLAIVAGAYAHGRRHQAAADAAALRGRQLATENAMALSEQNRLLYSGALVVAAQRARQVAQERDSIDRLLRVERRLRAVATVTLDTLREHVAGTGSVDTIADVRRARFYVEHEIATITADVELPRPPDTPWLRIEAVPRPIVLDVRAGCGERSEVSGLRPLIVSATARRGIGVSIGEAAGDPELCNPVAPPIGSWQRIRIQAPAAALGAVAGAIAVLVLR
jgi:hypothetical protein